MSSGQMTTVAVCFIHTIIKRNIMIRCELFCLILVILFVFALVLCIIFLFFSLSFCCVVVLKGFCCAVICVESGLNYLGIIVGTSCQRLATGAHLAHR